MADQAIREKKWKRSSDHKMLYVTTFGVRATDSEVHIDLGVEQRIEGEDVFYSEVQIILSHRGMKTFGAVLNSLVEKIESLSGPIALPPGKTDEIRSELKVERQTK